MSAVSDVTLIFLTTPILAVAIVYDWRTRRIPSPLILFGVTAGLVVRGFYCGADGLILGLSGLAVGLLLLLPGFLLRFTGAGDVKLLAMLGTFVGPSVILQIFALTAILGAALVLLMVLFRRHGINPVGHVRRYASMVHQFVVTRQFLYFPPSPRAALSERLPMRG